MRKIIPVIQAILVLTSTICAMIDLDGPTCANTREIRAGYFKLIKLDTESVEEFSVNTITPTIFPALIKNERA